MKMRRGALSFTIGLLITLCLLIANITWGVKGESLYKDSERFLPPTSYLLQDLLNVQTTVSERRVSEDIWGFDSFFDDDNQENEEDESLFINKPRPTAKIGSLYEYAPLINTTEDVELSVESAPDGFKLEGGSFQWIPTAEQSGRYDIILGVTDIDGIRTELSYRLIVTEHYHIFGTDQTGRDLAGLLIEGSRWTLLPGLVAALIAIVFGVFFGALSGFNQGKSAGILHFVVQVIESVPALLLFFLAAAIFNFSIYWIMVAVGISVIPVISKIISSMVSKFVKSQFVESAREMGFKEHVVLWRDIVWVNGKPAIATQLAYCFAFAILAEVTLSYLGLGIQIQEAASWGTLLDQGKNNLRQGYYWITVFPAIAITISILGFYMIGDGLGKLLDYRESN